MIGLAAGMRGKTRDARTEQVWNAEGWRAVVAAEHQGVKPRMLLDTESGLNHVVGVRCSRNGAVREGGEPQVASMSSVSVIGQMPVFDHAGGVLASLVTMYIMLRDRRKSARSKLDSAARWLRGASQAFA